jgi:general secretion pathway protein C
MTFYLKKYMWLISLVAVATCSYFLARLTSHLIAARFTAGVASVRVEKIQSNSNEKLYSLDGDDLKKIVERNIFDSKAVLPGEKPAEVNSEEQAEVFANDVAVQTSLKVKLVSTFSVGEGADNRSSCVVTAGGKEVERVYTVNDKNHFSPDVNIVKILSTRIEFINKGRLEFLELEGFANDIQEEKLPKSDVVVRESRTSSEEPKIEKKSENSFVIDRSEIEAAVNNVEKLLTQARAYPAYKDGKPNGLKITSLRSDSIFAKLGLRRGDVLKKINGIDVDMSKGFQLLAQLKDEKNVTIELERQDKPITQEYEIR